VSITPARLYVGQVLRHFREQAGLQQRELGAKLSVTGSLICMAETGRRAMSARELTRADEILHADGLLRAAIPLFEAERQDLRDHAPALRRARDYLECADAAFPALDDAARRHIAALALWALAPRRQAGDRAVDGEKE
jgi:transcriptional regulator with XRE-family HTH domain